MRIAHYVSRDKYNFYNARGNFQECGYLRKYPPPRIIIGFLNSSLTRLRSALLLLFPRAASMKMKVSCTICTDVISSDFAAAPCIHLIWYLITGWLVVTGFLYYLWERSNNIWGYIISLSFKDLYIEMSSWDHSLTITAGGHTFHFTWYVIYDSAHNYSMYYCQNYSLSQWLEHQASCPQCREKCLPKNVIRLFIDSGDASVTTVDDCLGPQELKVCYSII